MSFILDYCFLGKFTHLCILLKIPVRFLQPVFWWTNQISVEGMLNLPYFLFTMERATESVKWHLILLPLLVSSVWVFRSLRWKNIRIFTDIKIQSLIASSVLFLLVQNLVVISESSLGDLFPSETQESEGHHSGALNISQNHLWLFLSYIKLFLSSYI